MLLFNRTQFASVQTLDTVGKQHHQVVNTIMQQFTVSKQAIVSSDCINNSDPAHFITLGRLTFTRSSSSISIAALATLERSTPRRIPFQLPYSPAL